MRAALGAAERVFDLAWTHNHVLVRRLDASEAETQLYEQLASNVLYNSSSITQRTDVNGAPAIGRRVAAGPRSQAIYHSGDGHP